MAGPRRKKDEGFIATPDRQLVSSSGFCMTSHHHQCKYVFLSGKCGCDCHLDPNFESVIKEDVQVTVEIPEEVVEVVQTQKTQIVREEVAFIANSDDPRPWRKK